MKISSSNVAMQFGNSSERPAKLVEIQDFFCRLGSWPGQLKNVNWLRTAATQTLLENSVLGPAKSIMHNMDYKSFYLSKQLPLSLILPCIHETCTQKHPLPDLLPVFGWVGLRLAFVLFCFSCLLPFGLPSSQLFLAQKK